MPRDERPASCVGNTDQLTDFLRHLFEQALGHIKLSRKISMMSWHEVQIMGDSCFPLC